MKEYKYFQTQRYEQFAAMVRIDTERFEQVSDDPFRISVTPSGLCINGKYGRNPSKDEMRETLELMREAIAEWDKKYGSA